MTTNKHSTDCRDRQCAGCGEESELVKLRARVQELEHLLIFIGDKAVVDWDNLTVGQVDAVVPNTPDTYGEWARDTMASARKWEEYEKSVDKSGPIK